MKKEKLKRFLDQDNVVGYVFASPFILGFLLITVIPMILSLYYSFTDYRLGNPVSWIGLDNYIKMLSDARFLNSIRVTFLWSIDCLSFNEEYQRNDFLSFFVLCA